METLCSLLVLVFGQYIQNYFIGQELFLKSGFSIRIEVGGRIVEVGGEEVTRVTGATF